jgi:hypothetical protein
MLDWLGSGGSKRRARDGRVVIFHDHQLVFGKFVVEGQLITVKTEGGSKTARLEGSPAEALAKVLLRELAGDRRA